MAAATENEFSEFLSKKLRDINADVDLDVFVPYLTGILETEDMDREDMEEAIQGFLAEITEDDLEGHCSAIMAEWNKYYTSRDKNAQDKEKAKAMEEKIASIRQAQHREVERGGARTEEDRRRKEAILKQYAQVTEGAGSDPEDNTGDGEAAGGDPEDSLARNMNSIMVLEREREKRDKAKAASDDKRQKDKEDREKQKDKMKERKEAEKKRTQKGERRR